MRSRTKKPKKRSSSKSKSVIVAIRYFLLSVLVGIFVYVGGMYFFKPSPPCANSLTCESDLTEKIENGAVGLFQGHRVTPPTIDIAYDNIKPSVLGADTKSGEKHIYVDLSQQTLYAYQGDKKILQTLISSGRWGRTPVGNFHIWQKLRATRMAGGVGADAYDLPNVPFTMYFYHDFGLHGAYWHNNFGHTMSHGCVNMRQVDAEALFNWADGPTNGTKGTPVSICNQFIGPNTCIQDKPINS